MRWNDPRIRGLSGDNRRGATWEAWQATIFWAVLAALIQLILLSIFLGFGHAP